MTKKYYAVLKEAIFIAIPLTLLSNCSGTDSMPVGSPASGIGTVSWFGPVSLPVSAVAAIVLTLNTFRIVAEMRENWRNKRPDRLRALQDLAKLAQSIISHMAASAALTVVSIVIQVGGQYTDVVENYIQEIEEQSNVLATARNEINQLLQNVEIMRHSVTIATNRTNSDATEIGRWIVQIEEH